MPILTRAVEGSGFPVPIEHVVVCTSCSSEGPAVTAKRDETENSLAGAITAAKRAGFREVRDVDGGHFADWICPTCGGGLL